MLLRLFSLPLEEQHWLTTEKKRKIQYKRKEEEEEGEKRLSIKTVFNKKNQTYDCCANDLDIELLLLFRDNGIGIVRLATILTYCSGVYSVPNGANVGTAAVA